MKPARLPGLQEHLPVVKTSSTMAKVCLPGAVNCNRNLTPAIQSPPPINFFYEHFHNSIRTELDSLSRTVAKLTSASEETAADLAARSSKSLQVLGAGPYLPYQC